MTNDLINSIKDADLVLVGIGNEFEYDWSNLIENERYREIEKDLECNENFRWIVPILQKRDLIEYEDPMLSKAYHNLEQLLFDKNYFIVSLSTDDYLYRYSFNQDRIVSPCGGFRKLQCNCNCNRELYDVPDSILDDVKKYYNREITIEELKEISCENCGDSLRFNQLGVAKYAEEGYLEHWNNYTKWLQGTVNKKLCVLEIGVGMEFPSIVRFPFEKVVYYNQKSKMYRIHSSLYQVGEEISDKAYGIKENAVQYMANLI